LLTYNIHNKQKCVEGYKYFYSGFRYIILQLGVVHHPGKYRCGKKVFKPCVFKGSTRGSTQPITTLLSSVRLRFRLHRGIRFVLRRSKAVSWQL